MANTSKKLTIAVALTLAATMATSAQAQRLKIPIGSCGQVVVTKARLVSDIGPCPLDGVILAADGASLDLNGHRLFGDGDPNNTEQVGVRILGVKDAEVEGPGQIDAFNAGVAISGGSENTVKKLTVTNNVGSGLGSYGDGIAIDGSAGNKILDNEVTNNGPLSGVGLPNGSTGNLISGNSITDNAVARTQPVGQGEDAVRHEAAGVRFEGLSSGNVVSNNTIRRNGARGVNIIFSATDNQILDNIITDNGGNAVRTSADSHRTIIRGNTVTGNGVGTNDTITGDRRCSTDFKFCRDGIELASTSSNNWVEGNIVTGNSRDGIRVGGFSQGNQILSNQTGGNGGATAGKGAFDLRDLSPGETCGTNVWKANTYNFATPECTKAP